jgi:hypothetical protein
MPAAIPEQPRPESSLAAPSSDRGDHQIEPPIEHRDVTTFMALLGDIRSDVQTIRALLEEDDGEEEHPEADS